MPTRPPQTKYSTQNIFNNSYDTDFDVLTFELLGYDGSVLRRLKVNTNGEVVQSNTGFTSTYISTATTTTVRSGAGTLRLITITGGTAGTIIIYDNTAASGTKIADFDSTSAMGTYGFDIDFTIGLTIITSAATKLTVSSKLS